MMSQTNYAYQLSIWYFAKLCYTWSVKMDTRPATETLIRERKSNENPFRQRLDV